MLPLASVVDDRPPFFGLTFIVLVLGVPVFLAGGALVRNAVIGARPGVKSWLDGLLEDGSVLTVVGVLLVLGAYPVLMRRRGLALLPYAVMIAGVAMFFGPMIYWGWWHQQLPWQGG